MYRSKGFTLVEIAVVIAIGALLLGFGLSVLTAQLTNARIKATQNQANVIKKALITFIATNNRLPCPAVETLPDTDANYGVEAPNPGTCTGTTNLAPAATTTSHSRSAKPRARLPLSPSVDVLAMSHTDDLNPDRTTVDFVQDAIVADTHTVGVFRAPKPSDAGRKRIVRQRADGHHDARHGLPVERLEFPRAEAFHSIR